MLKKYLEFMRTIFSAITSNGGEVTFTDYLTGIGMSIAILALLVFFIAMIVGGWKFPCMIYKKLTKKLFASKVELVNKLTVARTETDMTAIQSLTKELADVDHALFVRRIWFAIGTIVLYIPIAVPTVLYLFYLVFHI